jgi:uncharacterized membrane protein
MSTEVEVETKWGNHKFGSIDIFIFFFINGDLNGAPQVQLHELFNGDILTII